MSIFYVSKIQNLQVLGTLFCTRFCTRYGYTFMGTDKTNSLKKIHCPDWAEDAGDALALASCHLNHFRLMPAVSAGQATGQDGSTSLCYLHGALQLSKSRTIAER